MSRTAQDHAEFRLRLSRRYPTNPHANRLEAIASTAYPITLYLEGANICLDHTKNDPRVPWVLVFLDFCAQSSDVELISKGSSQSSVPFPCVMLQPQTAGRNDVLKACALRIYPYERISLLHDFGSGFLSSFAGGSRLSYPVRAWYALTLAALATVDGPGSSRSHFNPNLRQFCYCSSMYLCFTPSGG